MIVNIGEVIPTRAEIQRHASNRPSSTARCACVCYVQAGDDSSDVHKGASAD
jgi:hypothetical protein